MKVVICGAGLVGFSIAQHLSDEGIDVTVIDQSKDLMKRISDNLDVQTVVGHASSPDVMERAGCADADMMIAVTFTDEVNMIACQVAYSLFNVPFRVARIRNQSYLSPQYATLFSRSHVPIDVIISPEKAVADEIMHRLAVPGSTNFRSFGSNKIRFIGVKLTQSCPLCDTLIHQIYDLFPKLDMRIVGLRRYERVLIPSRDESFIAGDEVFFMVRTEHVSRAMAAFGYQDVETRRVVIIGGGNVGFYLSQMLEAPHLNITTRLIELNRDRAEVISEDLPRTTVLNGSALDREVLHEANISQAEAVVAVTDDDEVNVIGSLLAKREGARSAFTIVNNASYDSLVETIGVDVVVQPRMITVSGILRHVRRGRIKDLYSVQGGESEVLEAEALETSQFIGRTIQDTLFSGMCIGAIIREEKVIMPTDETVIKAGDRVIVFVLKESVKKAEKFFSMRPDFF